MNFRVKCYIGLISVICSNLIFIEASNAALYSFTSHTFTNCSATGPTGPTQTACRSAYATTWDESDAYYKNISGIQYWTVPVSGTYRITAIGAHGSNTSGSTLGYGASIVGEFNLTESNILKILVGHYGSNAGGGGGGGGANAIGTNGSAGGGGAGGNGVTVFGKSVGGGGGGWTNTATNSFGGGNGNSTTASISCTPSCHGTANTGGGGGGGGNGGSGYIAIRYLNDSTAPTFTSTSSFSAAENISTSTNAATIMVSESATVTISSGADASRFNIVTSDSITAFIRFKVSPDFEAPTDVGSNNVYEITLTATDGASNAGTQSITITVTDVVDTSSFNSLTVSGAASFRQVVTITANVSTSSRVTFRARGIIISGCKNILTSGSSPNIIATCNWRPSTRGAVTLTATSAPTNVAISGAAATPVLVLVSNRSSGRS